MASHENDIEVARDHEWPERTERPRVLVENPDRAELLAHATILRDAGYDVAVCCGPQATSGEEGHCPLVDGERCSLVDGADVVVTTTSLKRGDEIIAALEGVDDARIIVEIPAPAMRRLSLIAPSATALPQPVTDGSLETAVAKALGR